MNNGQEQFFGFILERVQEDKVEEAKTLLAEAFKRQAEGTFTQETAMEFIPKMIALLKPEKIAEVQAIMQQYAGNIGH